MFKVVEQQTSTSELVRGRAKDRMKQGHKRHIWQLPHSPLGNRAVEWPELNGIGLLASPASASPSRGPSRRPTAALQMRKPHRRRSQAGGDLLLCHPLVARGRREQRADGTKNDQYAWHV